MSPERKQFIKEISRIFNSAVRDAQARNSELGIPNVYSRRGKVCFEPAAVKIKKPG